MSRRTSHLCQVGNFIKVFAEGTFGVYVEPCSQTNIKPVCLKTIWVYYICICILPLSVNQIYFQFGKSVRRAIVTHKYSKYSEAKKT